MLKVAQNKPWAARGDYEVPDIGCQKAGRNQKGIIPEGFVLPSQPEDHGYGYYRGNEQTVNDLQEFGKRAARDALQPDGGIGVPESVVQMGEPEIRICRAESPESE